MLLSKLKRLRNAAKAEFKGFQSANTKFKDFKNTAKAEFKAFQMQILNSKTLNLSILNTPNIFKFKEILNSNTKELK